MKRTFVTGLLSACMALSVNSQNVFFDDFDALSAFTTTSDTAWGPWRFIQSGNGRLSTQLITPHSPPRAVSLDAATSGTFNTNQFIFTLDLSAYDTASDTLFLDFQWTDFADETHATDGVFIRGDSSATWIKVYDFQAGSHPDGQWTAAQKIALTDSLRKHGQNYGNSFQVKFQQYDNYRIFSDGMAFDDVRIWEWAPDVIPRRLVRPFSRCYLDSAEAVSFEVKNHGKPIAAGTSIPYSIYLNGGLVCNATYTASHAIASNAVFTINAPAGCRLNLATKGTHQIRIVTHYAADSFPHNDTLRATVIHHSDGRQYPWADGFEANDAGKPNTAGEDSLVNGWQVKPGGGVDLFRWITEDGPTPSSNTGPSAPFSGARYVYTEASNPENGPATLTSPCIDSGTAAGVRALKYAYHMYGEAIGKLYVDVLGRTGEWVTLDSLIGPQQSASSDPWNERLLDLTPFAFPVQVRFRAHRNSAHTAPWRGDIAVDSVQFALLTDRDIAATRILAPSQGCSQHLGSTAPPFQVQNRGTYLPSGDTVYYHIARSGQNVCSTFYVLSSTWKTGEVLTIHPPSSCGISYPAGVSQLQVTAWVRADVNPANDTARQNVTAIPTISTFPYHESFESGPAGWNVSSDNGISTWELAQLHLDTSADNSIDTAAHGIYAWETDANAIYLNDERGYVISPCFDLSGLGYALFSMDVAFQTEAPYDGGAVDYRHVTASGASAWTRLGNVGSEWYNEANVNALNDWTGSGQGWSSEAAERARWARQYYVLPDTFTTCCTQFRVAFASDASITLYDGMAFDSVVIEQAGVDLSATGQRKPPADVGNPRHVQKPGERIVQPPDHRCGRHLNAPVSVKLTNKGRPLSAGTVITYSISLNGESRCSGQMSLSADLPYNATITANLPSNCNVNLGERYTHYLQATFSTSNDNNPLNDTVWEARRKYEVFDPLESALLFLNLYYLDSFSNINIEEPAEWMTYLRFKYDTASGYTFMDDTPPDTTARPTPRDTIWWDGVPYLVYPGEGPNDVPEFVPADLFGISENLFVAGQVDYEGFVVDTSTSTSNNLAAGPLLPARMRTGDDQYANYADYYFELPACWELDDTFDDTLSMSYLMRYDIEWLFDHLWIEYKSGKRNDSTSEWTPLPYGDSNSAVNWYTSSTTHNSQTIPTWSGTRNYWHTVGQTYRRSQLGNHDTVRFRFRFRSDATTTKAGASIGTALMGNPRAMPRVPSSHPTDTVSYVKTQSGPPHALFDTADAGTSRSSVHYSGFFANAVRGPVTARAQLLPKGKVKTFKLDTAVGGDSLWAGTGIHWSYSSDSSFQDSSGLLLIVPQEYIDSLIAWVNNHPGKVDAGKNDPTWWGIYHYHGPNDDDLDWDNNDYSQVHQKAKYYQKITVKVGPASPWDGLSNGMINGIMVYAAGIGAFSQFIITPPTPNGVPLPVEFAWFRARKEGHRAVLEWATASERHSRVFYVERAHESAPTRFETVGTVAAAGHSTRLRTYRFVDADPEKHGTYYYRIAEEDYDGQRSLSGVRKLTFAREEGVMVRPNPFTDEVTVAWPGGGGSWRVEVKDGLGRLVGRYHVTGQSTLRIDTRRWPKGAYHFRIYRPDRPPIQQTAIRQ